MLDVRVFENNNGSWNQFAQILLFLVLMVIGLQRYVKIYIQAVAGSQSLVNDRYEDNGTQVMRCPDMEGQADQEYIHIPMELGISWGSELSNSDNF